MDDGYLILHIDLLIHLESFSYTIFSWNTVFIQFIRSLPYLGRQPTITVIFYILKHPFEAHANVAAAKATYNILSVFFNMYTIATIWDTKSCKSAKRLTQLYWMKNIIKYLHNVGYLCDNIYLLILGVIVLSVSCL